MATSPTNKAPTPPKVRNHPRRGERRPTLRKPLDTACRRCIGSRTRRPNFPVRRNAADRKAGFQTTPPDPALCNDAPAAGRPHEASCFLETPCPRLPTRPKPKIDCSQTSAGSGSDYASRFVDGIIGRLRLDFGSAPAFHLRRSPLLKLHLHICGKLGLASRFGRGSTLTLTGGARKGGDNTSRSPVPTPHHRAVSVTWR